eukprot:759057-Hanusia_phi.AAC.1
MRRGWGAWGHASKLAWPPGVGSMDHHLPLQTRANVVNEGVCLGNVGGKRDLLASHRRIGYGAISHSDDRVDFLATFFDRGVG